MKYNCKRGKYNYQSIKYWGQVFSIVVPVLLAAWGLAFAIDSANKAKSIYSGQVFEIQTINGECYARDKKVWFGCNYFFKNKVLIRGAR